MKTIYLIACFLISIVSTAQNGFFDPNSAANKYLNGFKDGKWVEYVDTNWVPTTKENAEYYRCVVYKAGKPFGIVRDFYISGQMKYEGKIIQFDPEIIYDGKCRWYFRNGTLSKEITYVNGEECGGKGYYVSGTVWFECAPCVNGKANGVKKWYYKSGALEAEVPYVNNLHHGIQKVYYESGKLEAETHYENGEIRDTIKVYYPSGNIKNTIPYVTGEKQGIAKYYYESGKPEGEQPYVHGKLNGVVKQYYTSGTLAASYTYVNDTLEGDADWYYESGKIKSDAYFNKGKQSRVAYEWYPSGKMESSTPYENGMKNGHGRRYYETGELKETIEWYNDMQHGPRKYYLQDGTLVHHFIYSYGTYIRSEPTGYDDEDYGDD